MKEFELACPIGQVPEKEKIIATAARTMGVPAKSVAGYRILRRSVDARGDILYRYRILAYVSGETCPEFEMPEYRDVSSSAPVIIIGAGPAGMFAALRLLTAGLKPVILERGKDVHARKFDIAALSRTGQVDEDSNYCFGEGGAGTFSDGKLYTRSSKRGDIREVLHQLVRFGADPDILVDAHPHIGSDRLPAIVENIRKCIVEHGGEYHFGTRVTDIRKHPGHGLEVESSDGAVWISEKVILASGHSARDIYGMFGRKGLPLEAKGFALGVRVEHPQQLIGIFIRDAGRGARSLLVLHVSRRYFGAVSDSGG